jgi:hypothetical protein
MNATRHSLRNTHADSAHRTPDAAAFAFPRHWNSQDLADAVPLRLSEMLDFDAVRDDAGASANHLARRAGYVRDARGYARPAPLAAFRVR